MCCWTWRPSPHQESSHLWHRSWNTSMTPLNPDAASRGGLPGNCPCMGCTQCTRLEHEVTPWKASVVALLPQEEFLFLLGSWRMPLSLHCTTIWIGWYSSKMVLRCRDNHVMQKLQDVDCELRFFWRPSPLHWPGVPVQQVGIHHKHFTEDRKKGISWLQRWIPESPSHNLVSY